MKIKILKFLVFVYENHIQEDWEIYNNFGKSVVYPAWFVRSIFVWLMCPFFIPEYLFKQSKIYLTFQKSGEILSPQQMKKIQQMNKNKRKK